MRPRRSPRRCSGSRPLEGRKLWFVGIGGAGMSALALVARAWGAKVAGSDRARSSYVEQLEEAGIPVAIGHDAANVPDDAEVVVSSAVGADNPEVSRARVTKRRGELLAELVDERPSIVVGGAQPAERLRGPGRARAGRGRAGSGRARVARLSRSRPALGVARRGGRSEGVR